jgi:hypothetical protein
MARRIATIRGIAMRPGVSKNRRLYTTENITRAFERATARLAEDGSRPLTMYTHHDGARDATRLVGRITKLVKERDGTLRFLGDIADTKHGREIHALVDTEDGEPAFLDGVSIRGRWVGPVRMVRLSDGSTAETADDLEIDGIDFTSKPGVDDARIEGVTAVAGADPAEAWTGEGLIFESADHVLVEATKTPYGDVDYADPGYLPDKKKRYPVNSERRARAAWSYINQADNARKYTAKQLKRVKGRIKKALRQFGVTVTAETAAPLVPLAEDATYGAVAECYGDSGAGFSLTARNGPITVNISAYNGIEPAELAVIAKAAMCAACDALAAMDPDMDADIDVPGAPDADTDSSMEAAAPGRPDDDQMESAPTAGQFITPEQAAALQAANLPLGTVVTPAVLAEALAQTAPAAPAAATPTPQEVPAVSEQPTTPAVAEAATTTPPAAPVIQLTAEQFQQLLAGRAAPVAETAPAAPAPAAPAAPVAETEEQRIARLVEARLATEREQLLETVRNEVRQAGPARKGLSRPRPGAVTETADPESPEAQRAAYNEALVNWVSNGRYSNYED